MAPNHSLRLLSEMAEFAAFTAAEQRYIRRSLDVGLRNPTAAWRWARSEAERASIVEQTRHYRVLSLIRASAPDDLDIDAIEAFVGPATTLAAFDLGESRIRSFAAFRFLYERLIGAAARPFLPSIFCAAAALPIHPPARRKILLESIQGHEAMAVGWSSLDPCFYPEWVDKVPEAVA